jgi:hypothetical protein
LPAYVFAHDGSYAAVDKATYKILQQGSVLSLAGGPGSKLAEMLVVGGVWDRSNRTVFLSLMERQMSRAHGYLIIDDRSLKTKGQITANGPLLPDQGRQRFLLNQFPREDAGQPGLPLTKIYDTWTLQGIGSVKSSDLLLSRSACFFQDDEYLYTNLSVFDALTLHKLREVRTDRNNKKLSWLSSNCERGLIAFITVNQKPQGQATILLYDIAEDLVKKVIDTPYALETLNSEDWVLSSDGTILAWNASVLREAKYGGTERVSPGTLTFISLATDAPRVSQLMLEVNPGEADNQIVGFSADSSKLFYRSGTSLVVIDARELRVIGKLSLPSRPVLVLW